MSDVSPGLVPSTEGERPHADLDRTVGFLVADARGRVVGRVERAIYGRPSKTPDALCVRFSLLGLRRRRVPADVIETIDDGTMVIGLRIDRSAIGVFQ